MSTLATNKQAFFDYEILETIQAGLELTGAEVKSLRAGSVSLKEAIITIRNSELFLTNAHISPYPQANTFKVVNPTRSRKLLVKKSEIGRLIGLKSTQGLTIVPLKVYTKNHLIKLEIGVGRGRKKYDKRELIKKRDVDRELRRNGGAGL